MAGLEQGVILAGADLKDLLDLRHDLHRHPEVSGREAQTARRIEAFLAPSRPDQILRGLGGHGLAAVYDSGRPGPRVLLRCELDGLPIEDLADVPHRSTVPGVGHQCGHDGHMTMVAAMSRSLARQRPRRGSVVLMFQPAEEDGTGANAVVNDPAFAAVAPDYAFAIHNMPGIPLGDVHLVDGPICCASRGMIIRLRGRTSHASQPESGRSPMRALSKLMIELTAMSSPSGTPTADVDFRLVTVTHAQMGAPAFGITPGEACIFATLRSLTNEGMDNLVTRAEALAESLAEAEGLNLKISYSDAFVTCNNAPEATAIVRKALDRIGVAHAAGDLPMRGSEDFGSFGRSAHGALLLLGSGTDVPALHNPDFDFPDALISKGAAIFSQILDTAQLDIFAGETAPAGI